MALKIANGLYLAFIAIGLLIAAGVPLLVHETDSAVSGWQGLVQPGPISTSHAAFADQCTACHKPHEGVEPTKCIACHAATDFGNKQSTQFHAQAKECTSCHVEHEGDAGIVRMDHAALVLGDLWARLPERVSTPSRSPEPNGDPLSSLNCASCHSNRDPHARLFGQTCSSCHGTDKWQIEGFRHPSVNSTECSQCHQAPPSHRMMHFAMVSQRVAGEKASVEQCYACHTTDAWNNIRRVGWYDHH